MGCSLSASTPVRALVEPEDERGAEGETGGKLDGRGDSAASKVTADSGVVIEDGPAAALPGEVPGKPTDGAGERDRRDDVQLESRRILEELEHQGIIPVGQRASAAGEAYSIMLDGGEAVRRRPPARLESLKAAQGQGLPSREACEDKMRLAEERRKSRENELRTRLRAKSARAPASGADEEPADANVSAGLSDPASPGRIERQEAEGEGRAGGSLRDVGGEGEMGRPKGGSEDGDGEEEEEEEEEEELTQVVELMNELCDSRCQSPQDKETF